MGRCDVAGIMQAIRIGIKYGCVISIAINSAVICYLLEKILEKL